jgi:hypothetical protein
MCTPAARVVAWVDDTKLTKKQKDNAIINKRAQVPIFVELLGACAVNILCLNQWP